MPTVRQPLTLDRIVDAALELIDDIGLTSFSMRKLGQALGFEAMAIYKHVADKEALLDHVVAELYAGVTPPNPDDPWQTRLRHLAHEQRRIAIAHPHLFQRMFTQPPASPSVTTVIDSILTAIRDALGSHADELIGQRFWLYVSTTSGALLAETNAATPNNSFVGMVDMDLAQCPALLEFGGALAACDYAGVYEDCLNTIISVLEAKP